MIGHSYLKDFIHNLKPSDEDAFITNDEDDNEHIVTGTIINDEPYLTLDGRPVDESEIYDLLVY